MKRFKPTLWLSFGLVSLTLALALTAYIFGFMPDGYKAELNSRAKIAESIAVQLAGSVNRNDTLALKETIDTIVSRNEDILSTALRNAQGKIIISAGDHESNWISSDNGKSTPTHVFVPLLGANGPQGNIEIAFSEPSSGKRILGFPVTLLMFLGFLMSTGFIGYFFILRRTLKELDPGRVIPERVQKAFDTLSEGVIILDEQERILLLNDAFSELYGDADQPTLGAKINHLQWRMVDGSAKAGGYPWHTALQEGREMREGALSLRTPDGKIHNFNVNATVISGEKNNAIGAIVTLRDMTGSNRNSEDLKRTLEELQKTQSEVKRQNRELTYLANHDGLTGCLNRRAFFGRFQSDIEQAPDLGTPISVMMINFNQFQQINNDKGTVAGDKLIIGVANLIKAECGTDSYTSRHSADKFCVAMNGLNEEDTTKLINKVKKSVSDSSRQLLPGGLTATLTIGVTSRLSGSCTAHSMVHRADQALALATNQDGDDVITWDENTAEKFDDNTSVEVLAPTAKPAKIPGVMFPSTQASPSRAMTQLENDNLSKLNTQEAFFTKVDLSLVRAKTKNRPVAILQMSLVSWEYLGEALGEELRQKLMIAVEAKVSSTLRENDGVLVLGDNGEWLIELSDLEEVEDVNWVVKRLLDALSEPFKVEDQTIFITGKIGIAVFPEDGNDMPTLTRNARSAMRRAVEEKHLDGFKFYSSDMKKKSSERLQVETGIRSALNNNEFELYFQPITCAQTGNLKAAEALLRCHNEQLGGIPIYQVIEVAEKSSLITEIDMWVLNAALKQQQRWCDSGVQLPKVSINLSAKQLNNIEFMDEVFETIKAVNFSPSRVQIEITETAQMADVDIAAPQLKRLQQLGVQIALDDFGTGQASLTYLQRLHPDVIKIDRSFITGVHTNHANATMVSAMIVMAHCLGLTVVAEGVEDEDQLNFLKETKCDDIQGYLISRPMPAQMMGEWVRRFNKKEDQENFEETDKASQLTKAA